MYCASHTIQNVLSERTYFVLFCCYCCFSSVVDEGGTLNGGLVALRFSGNLDQFCYEGGRTPFPPLDPRMRHNNRITTHKIPQLTVIENCFSYFSTKTYVVGTQKNRLDETVLLSTQNTC